MLLIVLSRLHTDEDFKDRKGTKKGVVGTPLLGPFFLRGFPGSASNPSCPAPPFAPSSGTNGNGGGMTGGIW